MQTEGAGAGTRGGPLPPLTLDEATALMEKVRSGEMGWLREAILGIAHRNGEFHADALADVPLHQRNAIGASVNALVKRGLLTTTGEHRKGKSAASHGRRSYVYRLTPRGRHIAPYMVVVLPRSDEGSAPASDAPGGHAESLF